MLHIASGYDFSCVCMYGRCWVEEVLLQEVLLQEVSLEEVSLEEVSLGGVSLGVSLEEGSPEDVYARGCVR